MADIASRCAIRTSEQLERVRQARRDPTQTASLVIKEGDREVAHRFLADWLARNARSYLTVVDQYFGPNDLSMLLMVPAATPDLRVRVLTSGQHQDRSVGTTDIAEFYRRAWRDISDQDPPPTEVVVLRLEKTGLSPVHDRWLLTMNAGLRLGTSFNSLGSKISEISVLTPAEAALRDEEIRPYLERERRSYEGQRLQYFSFTL